MKNIVIFIILTSFTSLKSQIVQSSCIAHDSIYNKYKRDADKLNYRRIYHINSTYKDSIGFSKTISKNYLNTLVAVYNATALPAVDTIVNILNIHAFNPVVHAILVKADSNLLWMTNIRDNIIPCGNSTVDSLLNKYYLKKDSYNSYYFNPDAYLVLKTDSNCNVSALGRKIKTIAGVFSADSSFYAGDNNNIIDSITTNYTWLVYSYGWGDCPSGCFHKRYWGFRVYNDCSVEYMGSFGAPLTVGVKENLNSLTTVKVYPNPFNNQLTIQLPTTNSNNKKFKITNTLGQVVLEKSFLSDDLLTLNTSLVHEGIYILTTYINNLVYSTQKIIKQ